MAEVAQHGVELLADVARARTEPGEVAFWWLGQHSFIVKGGETVVYIDSTALKLCEWTGHPENYDRAVLIYRSNQSPPCCCFVDPEILCVSSWLHLSVPHDKCTVDQLIAEAIRLADN